MDTFKIKIDLLNEVFVFAYNRLEYVGKVDISSGKRSEVSDNKC